jgi:biofilm PGA synthesis N-glycosyltransferase PgaC
VSAEVNNRYVLVTAACNEEKFIEGVLRSVIGQTVLPIRWVVVSDGSTDATDAIVRRYGTKYQFIRLLRLGKTHKRNFGAQVRAISEGCEQLKSLDYDYIGNLDADVSFDRGYFAELLDRFQTDSQLGLAGGAITEEDCGLFRERKRNSPDSVAHAVQLFRRECFDAIGGYPPLRYGGPDWHAAVVARMKGWRVESFQNLPVRHHRPTGTAEKWQRDCFRQGCMDFSLGSHPVFEIIKCIRRIPDKPRLAGALTRLSGFVWCYCTGQEREVSGEFMKFLRKEQMSRVRSIVKRWRFSLHENAASPYSHEL